MTSSARHRRVSRRSTWSRRRRWTRAPLGTETRMASGTKFLSPAATSAEAPSRKARGPPSSTAAHHRASGGKGPQCIATAWRPTARHRRARRCALTSPRLTPPAYSCLRDSTPAWLPAIADKGWRRSSHVLRGSAMIATMHLVWTRCTAAGSIRVQIRPPPPLWTGHGRPTTTLGRPAVRSSRRPLRRTSGAASCDPVAQGAASPDVPGQTARRND